MKEFILENCFKDKISDLVEEIREDMLKRINECLDAILEEFGGEDE